MKKEWETLEAEPPTDGTVMRLLVARNRLAAGGRQQFQWTPVLHGNHHSPTHFGEVVFRKRTD